MIGPQRVTSIDAGIHLSAGMRVVLFNQDEESCARLRDAIGQEYGFVLAGVCQEWAACEVLLDRFVPELLIAESGGDPSQIPGEIGGLRISGSDRTA